MNERTTKEIAESFGLALETVVIDEQSRAYRVYKGASQIFFGTGEAVREFLDSYRKERPEPYQGSMYGYKE